MTPQTIRSEERFHGPIPDESGGRENVVEAVITKEEDIGGDGEVARRGHSFKEKINTFPFGGDDVCHKFVKGRKIDLCKENLEKIYSFNDNDHGDFERDVLPSDVLQIAVVDTTFSKIVNVANNGGGEINANGELVDIYKNKNMFEKEIHTNLHAIGRKCDKKCMQNGDRKLKGEKSVPKSVAKSVAQVTKRRKTCWRRSRASLAGPSWKKGSPSCILSSTISTFVLLVEKTVLMAVLWSVFSAITNVPVICAESMSFDKEVEPVFLEPVPNVTVAVGRDASLTCAVDHLGLHKVAWIHLDRQMIVSIHNHVITRQPRFTVTHDSHKTWTLQVSGVMEEDRGHYMCQVNTKPMISQTGFLQVVVPPNIVDKVSSKSNIVVREKDNVTLVCRGEGFPLPQIKWRREDSQPIETSDDRKVHQLDGPNLVLHQVSRTHMGAYLCIATNGVPPSVSKRITLDVEFAPQMHVPNQLVGSPMSTEVHLECFVEAHPRAITYWEFLDSMVMNSSRVTTKTVEDRYKIHMTLTIRDLQGSDFGMYKCISKNSIAETDGSITLNKTLRPTSPPQTMLHGYDDEDNPYRNRGRQGRKEQHRKKLEETRRRNLEEEEKRREGEEARRRAKEMERQRLEHDFDRGQRNEQATRVTHTQSGSRSLFFTDVPLLSRCLLALYILSWIIHI